MASIPWETIKSLLIFFGPIILPKAIGFYRNARNDPRQNGLTVQPVPPKVARSLAVLFAVAAVFLTKSLPIFAPENVFEVTQSRLQAPADVIFNRLSTLRPNGSLTAQDTALRAKFVSLESRLLYAQYGPEVLASCPFCSSDEPRSYLYYAAPAIAAPHLFNLAVVAAITSPLLAGREAASWRRTATLAAIVVGATDLWLVSVYGHQANARALRLADVDFFFWSSRVRRGLALAGLDALLGWLLYLSATNRAFVLPPAPVERVDRALQILAGAKSRLNAMGVIKNTLARDADLRQRITAYWVHEVNLMGELMEEREVVESVNDALQHRINMQTITRDADDYSKSILSA